MRAKACFEMGTDGWERGDGAGRGFLSSPALPPAEGAPLLLTFPNPSQSLTLNAMNFESGSCRGCHGFPCPEEQLRSLDSAMGRRKMEDWDFLHHCGGERQGKGILLPSPLSSPSPLPVLILSVLPLHILNRSLLLGWAGDAAFPSRRISGGTGLGWASQGLQVSPGSRIEPGHLMGNLAQGGRVVESLGEERGREWRKRRWGGRTEGLCPPHSRTRGSGLALQAEKQGRAPQTIAPPKLGRLLSQLGLCPSCWKWNETQSSPCWGPVYAQS